MNHKKNIFGIQFAVFIYSIVSVFSKLAGTAMREKGVFSPQFILIVGGMFLFLGIYAILWQSVLKENPLSVAYIHKGVGLFWTMIWSVLLFKESIAWNNILGLLLIIGGIATVTYNDI